MFVTCNCSTGVHLKLCKYVNRMLQSAHHFVFNFDNAEKLEMVCSCDPDNISLNHIVFSVLSVVANYSLDRRGIDHAHALRVRDFWPSGQVKQEADTSHKRSAEHNTEENGKSKRLVEPSPPNSVEHNQYASVLEEWAHVDLGSNYSDSHTISEFLDGLEREHRVDLQTPTPSPAPQEEIVSAVPDIFEHSNIHMREGGENSPIDIFDLLNTQLSPIGPLEASTPINPKSRYEQLLSEHRKLQSSYALLESSLASVQCNFICVTNKYENLVNFSARLAIEYNRTTPFLQVRLPDDEELHSAIRRLQPEINK